MDKQDLRAAEAKHKKLTPIWAVPKFLLQWLDALLTLWSYAGDSQSTEWNGECSLRPSHEGLECC